MPDAIPRKWACWKCGQPRSTFYGLPGLERCLECWMTDPGYDRPADDPYLTVG